MTEYTFAAIKGSFKGEISVGAFYLKLDIKTKKIVSSRFAIKHNTEHKDIELHLDFDDFAKEVDSMYSNISETDPTFDNIAILESSFVQSFPTDKLEKIVNLIISSGDEYLRNILIRDLLTDEIKKHFNELYGKVNIQIEELLPKCENNDDENRDNAKNNMQNEIIKTKALMDPINGIIAENLEPGIELVLKLADQKNLDQYYDILNFLEEDKDAMKAKIIGEITEVKPPDEEGITDIKVMVKLAPKLFTLISLQPKLKLMINGDTIIENTQKSEELQNSSILSSNNFILIISALIAIFILLIILYLVFT